MAAALRALGVVVILLGLGAGGVAAWQVATDVGFAEIAAAYERWGDELVNEPSFACMPDVLWKVSRMKPRFSEVPLSLHYDRKPGPSKMQVFRTIRRSLALLVKRRVGINS